MAPRDVPVVIEEGGHTEYIEFYLNLPPSFMCNASALAGDDACEVHVTASVDITGDVSCVGGATIPQMLVGYSDEIDEATLTTCGVRITDLNWYMDFKIPVVATVDRLVDGDQERHLVVWQQVMAVDITGAATLMAEEQVADIEVGHMMKYGHETDDLELWSKN